MQKKVIKFETANAQMRNGGRKSVNSWGFNYLCENWNLKNFIHIHKLQLDFTIRIKICNCTVGTQIVPFLARF